MAARRRLRILGVVEVEHLDSIGEVQSRTVLTNRKAAMLLTILGLEAGRHHRDELVKRLVDQNASLSRSDYNLVHRAVRDAREALGDVDKTALKTNRTMRTYELERGAELTIDIDEAMALEARDRAREALALHRGRVASGIDEAWIDNPRKTQEETVERLVRQLAPEASDSEVEASVAEVLRGGVALEQEHHPKKPTVQAEATSFSQDSSGNQALPRAVVLCATREEYDVLRQCLSEPQQVPRTSYERGVLDTPSGPWAVLIYATGQGNSGSAAATAGALHAFNPALALFVGVAGGFAEKGITHGDLVIATEVHQFQSGAAEEEIRSRPLSFPSDDGLCDAAALVSYDEGWLDGEDVDPSPRVHSGHVVSGEILLRSMDSETYHFIRKTYNHAVAVEMEGYGFLKAAHKNRVRALVIRGISDLLDDKTAKSDAEQQPRAVKRAVNLVTKLLARVRDEMVERSAIPSTPGQDQALGAALKVISGMLKEHAAACTELRQLSDSFGSEYSDLPSAAKSQIVSRWALARDQVRESSDSVVDAIEQALSLGSSQERTDEDLLSRLFRLRVAFQRHRRTVSDLSTPFDPWEPTDWTVLAEDIATGLSDG